MDLKIDSFYRMIYRDYSNKEVLVKVLSTRFHEVEAVMVTSQGGLAVNIHGKKSDIVEYISDNINEALKEFH